MSFPEILEAVKTLERDEKIQLMRHLENEIGPLPPGNGHDVNAELAALLMSGGVFHTGYQVTTDAAGYALIEKYLNESKASS